MTRKDEIIIEFRNGATVPSHRNTCDQDREDGDEYPAACVFRVKE